MLQTLSCSVCESQVHSLPPLWYIWICTVVFMKTSLWIWGNSNKSAVPLLLRLSSAYSDFVSCIIHHFPSFLLLENISKDSANINPLSLWVSGTFTSSTLIYWTAALFIFADIWYFGVHVLDWLLGKYCQIFVTLGSCLGLAFGKVLSDICYFGVQVLDWHLGKYWQIFVTLGFMFWTGIGLAFGKVLLLYYILHFGR